jgi:quinol monooxygenase YgiN
VVVHVVGEMKVQDVETFVAVFSTAGSAKRGLHGCTSAQAFAAADEPGRVLVLLTWPDVQSFERFRSDPEVAPIMASAGIIGLPRFTVLERVADVAS